MSAAVPRGLARHIRITLHASPWIDIHQWSATFQTGGSESVHVLSMHVKITFERQQKNNNNKTNKQIKKNPHAKKQNKINSCTCKLSSPNQIAPSQSRDTPPVDALPFLELIFVLSLAETGCVAIYWEPHYYVAATAHRAINGDHRAPVVLNGGEEWGGINKLCHETAVSGGVDGPCINSG